MLSIATSRKVASVSDISPEFLGCTSKSHYQLLSAKRIRLGQITDEHCSVDNELTNSHRNVQNSRSTKNRFLRSLRVGCLKIVAKNKCPMAVFARMNKWHPIRSRIAAYDTIQTLLTSFFTAYAPYLSLVRIRPISFQVQ